MQQLWINIDLNLLIFYFTDTTLLMGFPMSQNTILRQKDRAKVSNNVIKKLVTIMFPLRWAIYIYNHVKQTRKETKFTNKWKLLKVWKHTTYCFLLQGYHKLYTQILKKDLFLQTCGGNKCDDRFFADHWDDRFSCCSGCLLLVTECWNLAFTVLEISETGEIWYYGTRQ